MAIDDDYAHHNVSICYVQIMNQPYSVGEESRLEAYLKSEASPHKDYLSMKSSNANLDNYLSACSNFVFDKEYTFEQLADMMTKYDFQNRLSSIAPNTESPSSLSPASLTLIMELLPALSPRMSPFITACSTNKSVINESSRWTEEGVRTLLQISQKLNNNYELISSGLCELSGQVISRISVHEKLNSINNSIYNTELAKQFPPKLDDQPDEDEYESKNSNTEPHRTYTVDILDNENIEQEIYELEDTTDEDENPAPARGTDFDDDGTDVEDDSATKRDETKQLDIYKKFCGDKIFDNCLFLLKTYGLLYFFQSSAQPINLGTDKLGKNNHPTEMQAKYNPKGHWWPRLLTVFPQC
ncbi:hypothetical protein BDA99DRAFT_563132 [Phascolomyces articulosus]|uniref:Uncharacterized protein n=1 Tax=Phascolomyces articulosus TaxID=60185 RepID=A0AAD5JSQ8_9FUNG|nr:hypothetical protein BDA99DRAFT_563132 [Phascolomyces articulosus]